MTATKKPTPRQLPPLQVNPKTGECFLRLAAPHENFIITPPRLSDIDAVQKSLDRPEIYLKFRSIPHPYSREKAESFVRTNIERSDGVLTEIGRGSDEDDDGDNHTTERLNIVSGCPVRSIRKVLEDGTDTLVGDIQIFRLDEMRLAKGATTENTTALQERNDTLAVGHPDIVWSITDWMHPDWHGKGIMTAAIRAIIRNWAVPRMGARKFCVSAFDNNIGSRRVFEKNGFKLRTIVHNCDFVRGEWRGICVLDLEKEGEGE